jgi:membrane protease YdiL (CAAX protease family)
MSEASPAEPELILLEEVPQGCRFHRAHWLPRDAAVGVALALLMAGAVYYGSHRLLARLPTVVWLLESAVFEFGILLGVPLWLLSKRSDCASYDARPVRRAPREFIIAIPLTFVVLLCTGAVVLTARAVLSRMGRSTESALDFWGQTSEQRLIPLIILAVFVAPVVEEVFFRGFLYNALRSVFAPWIAILLQASLFGLGHIYEPLGVVGTFVIGILLALIYEWRKTLMTNMFVHGMYNGIGMLAIAAAVMANAKGPMIGVTFQPDTTGQAVVDTVIPGSPAEQADIRPGDVIVLYNGREVTEGKQLIELVRAGKVGNEVSIEILRAEQRLTKSVVLRSRAELE